MIKIGVYGATGKIGTKLVEYINSATNIDIALGYAYSRSNSNNSLEQLFKNSDVIIDFSSPEGLTQLLDLCIQNNKPLVSGTTGIDENLLSKLKSASVIIPIFYAPNMSIGANLLGLIAGQFAKELPKEYDIEIIDIHHSTKKDAPAGTALQIANQIKSSDKVGHNLNITSIRTGNNPGEYNILFSGDDESISISHKVYSKIPYVIGACKAAIWLSTQSPGFYNMYNIML